MLVLYHRTGGSTHRASLESKSDCSCLQNVEEELILALVRLDVCGSDVSLVPEDLQ